MTTTTRNPCVGCGGPKPSGIGRRWCDTCRALPPHQLVSKTAQSVRSRATITDTGCVILPLTPRNKYGYTTIVVAGRPRQAHRFFYEQAKGPIPDGLVIDHLCRNGQCVNPDHMEPVTDSENKSRERKPFCRKGHLLAEHGWPGGRLHGCRTCRLADMARVVACPTCGQEIASGNLRRHRKARHVELEAGWTA